MTERTERRLAAILAADVAGYSRLMGADEEGTLAALKSHRRELIDPKIAAHRGRIVKTTGDGALVEFGSVVDAVRCAAEIQQAMAGRNEAVPQDKRIAFRIGINVGDIIIDGDDIYGDGVNVAARLEGLAEPGGIFVSGAAYDQVKGKLPFAFDDLGAKEVKNIAEPVRVYRIAFGATAQPNAGERPALPLPDRPSIAVLPFANMSGDPEQEYFADGIAEDIITALSRFHWFFVIARNSSFTYKGKHVDVRTVGRELGVRYVLEGSVRKGGNRLRITAQLVEAATGNHLWAEKYDGAVEDVFELQDRITASVVGAIEPSVRQAEIERAKRKRPENLDTYDLVLRALPYLNTRRADDATKAIPLVEKALALDPGYGFAEAVLAWCYHQRFHRGGLRPEDGNAAIRHARAAITTGSNDADALALSAFVIAGSREHDTETALGLLDRALALAPSSLIALTYSAFVLASVGRSDEAVVRADYALRLSPFDPFSIVAHNASGIAHMVARRFDAAADSFQRSIEANPRLSQTHMGLAIAFVGLGKFEEAKAAARRSLELEPSRTIRSGTAFLKLPPAKLVPIIEALREAGLPE